MGMQGYHARRSLYLDGAGFGATGGGALTGATGFGATTGAWTGFLAFGLAMRMRHIVLKNTTT
jgi:hypothetical protein